MYTSFLGRSLIPFTIKNFSAACYDGSPGRLIYLFSYLVLSVAGTSRINWLLSYHSIFFTVL